MAKYLTDVEFREQVRVCLDQNMTSDALSLLEDVDTLSLDEIIESKAEDAALSVINAAPIYKLGDVSKELDVDISITAKKPYKVSVPLPSDFARLVRFNMESWRYPIHEALPPFTPLYDQANSGFNTFGTKDRPAAFLVPTDEGKKLEVFCAKDVSDVMDGCRYAAKPEKEGDIYITGIALSWEDCDIVPGLVLVLNESKTLTATITPLNATNLTLAWESSNESVATVNSRGEVTAYSEGECWITCKATDGSGKYAKCHCVVTDAEAVITSEEAEDIGGALSPNASTPVKYTVIGKITDDSIHPSGGRQSFFIGDIKVSSAEIPEEYRFFENTMPVAVTAKLFRDAEELVIVMPCNDQGTTIGTVTLLKEQESGTDEADVREAWRIKIADDLVRPTIYYAAYLTALEVKDDNAAEKLLAIAKAMIEE